MSTQHGSLTPARWSGFSLDQQILMIGNEMNRASKLMTPELLESRQDSYECALRLVDLTVDVQESRSLRRELLLWREVMADLYLRQAAEPATHRMAFKLLLQLTPEAAKQVEALGL
jgi:hypothetical protein